MFGLENQKKGKKKAEPFVFELEKEFKDLKYQKILLEKVQNRVNRVKDVLRSGEEKEKFDQYGVLLQGYAALLKVFERMMGEKK